MTIFENLTKEEISLMQSVYELARDEYAWSTDYDWEKLDKIYQYDRNYHSFNTTEETKSE